MVKQFIFPLLLLSTILQGQESIMHLTDDGAAFDVGDGAMLCVDNLISDPITAFTPNIGTTEFDERYRKSDCTAPITDIGLPVTLSEFYLENHSSGVLAIWQTESEIENLGFILEKKDVTNQTGWVEIASYKTSDELLGQGTVSSSTDYEYFDNLVESGRTYEYRLSDVSYDGIVTNLATRSITVFTIEQQVVPKLFTVAKPYPNPFNPSVNIKYGISESGTVKITVFDIRGHELSEILNEYHSAGWHEINWNGKLNNGESLTTGTYLVKIAIGDKTKFVKVSLLK